MYRVKALNGGEVGPQSNFVNVQRPAATPTPMPTPTPAPALTPTPDPYAKVKIVPVFGADRISPGSVHTMDFNANYLPKDSDPETVELTMVANVVDAKGNAADGCEADGLGTAQHITVVDSQVETLTVGFGNTNEGSCWVGEYTVVAEFTAPPNYVLHTCRVTFAVTGYDGNTHH